MPVLDAKKTYQNLLSKGFTAAKGDHKFLEFFFNGKFILHTKISHGEKELQDFHIGMMKRQCKLEKKEFIDLANCPLSADQYLQILKSNGIISAQDLKGIQENEKKQKK
ncbi:MAG TPA: hypothetical protein PKA77_02305 [Chitinophagaceae bacterium]|jgi:hypothetical protein|nr:hypothetical protein [Saprospiraceae bacterium]HMT72879.1 hypothetical protein [Chitinophagaceae bacterium]